MKTEGHSLRLPAGLLAPLSWPAAAQQPVGTPTVGVLMPGSLAPGSLYQARLAALRRGLAELGYAPDRDLLVEPRSLETPAGSFDDLARELVGLQPAAIVTEGDAAVRALRRLTTEVPVVVAITGDLVGVGHAQSLRRPGGNVTGLVDVSPEVAGKRLQLIAEVRPVARRIGVVWNSANPVKVLDFEATRSAAGGLGREVVSLPVAQPQDLEIAFARARAEGVEAFVVLQDTFVNRQVGALSGLAVKAGVPTLAGTRDFVLAGGLLSYSVDFAEAWRYAASYVDRILRGASPAELPIEQATAFRLVINLKTARELGIAIPPSILLRADEVIE